MPGHATLSQGRAARSTCSVFMAEGAGLLHWAMLAASTIGPGSVIVCSKAGSDYGLSLIWTLVLASSIAYTLQEGSARLRIVSRAGLGQAMRFHFGTDSDPSRIPLLCYAIAGGIMVGNGAYEANNFAGATEAMYAMEVPQNTASRVMLNFVFGALCVLTLLFGDVDLVSKALGTCVVAMMMLFGYSALIIGADAGKLFLGLVPIIPPGAGTLALSLVATTAVPFNCFLASSAADGSDIAHMQRGKVPGLILRLA